jgi:hypothetical protein
MLSQSEKISWRYRLLLKVKQKEKYQELTQNFKSSMPNGYILHQQI